MGSLFGDSPDVNVAGVTGEFTGAGGGTGVLGVSADGNGVHGESTANHGVHGHSITGRGVQGISEEFFGVGGKSTHGVGVFGESVHSIGVLGKSPGSFGVQGISETNHGVHGDSTSGRGVVGTSQTFFGVSGESKSGDGVFGISDSGIGVHGKGGRLAGFFDGDVEVTGDLRLLNADCAEDFDVFGAVKAEPGTVMVLGNEGVLSESYQAYDKRVAGVISGAGNYKPGIVMDKQQTSGNRQPVALMGKVFCKVDAQFGAIEVGDLLTTSPTPGHAMRTSDPFRAFGAVIGKALRTLAEGQGLIPILIALQ